MDATYETSLAQIETLLETEGVLPLLRSFHQRVGQEAELSHELEMRRRTAMFDAVDDLLLQAISLIEPHVADPSSKTLSNAGSNTLWHLLEQGFEGLILRETAQFLVNVEGDLPDSLLEAEYALTVAAATLEEE